ncbi:DNA mismatch repair endonuclease MutL [Pelotomaculum propionicicum]|uniref:DNA mismatch repair protein MutL n=1 Tax=Pelotomaculum propionicicum TaxID=258475 RepID=A0A4Y7RUI6_9FIRM|nr:DNA mismatch repair endonuclease MutL [Pelotomaculum propionicicum]NLI13748.1 DNA mismatch repair endonuclease MutL [Peptococcaceae bacterium]TEB12541.1 DNA mismatch repair protein MutL [Pelotomaculum propionicicum]
MAKIILLDEMTINQIAAGEVVERPVSVVKELVENSLDAGAGRIITDLEEGGLSSVTVADDGCGMNEEDLLLAFERHATSKISVVSDLSRIGTLGFRGEAIPSIAAVSRMSFTTRVAQAINGARAEAAGGSLLTVVPVGCPPGSTVVVKDLFFNTPVRKKTMKSPSMEGSLCGEIITRLALTRPEVSFELRNNGRRVFYSNGSGRLLDALISVYGAEQAREMILVDAAAGGMVLKGFTSKPALSRSSRSHITTIINGRYVQCAAIRGAVEEAYRTILPRGRSPVAVLEMTLAPELIDVNVHPAKLEVRLLEEKEAAELVIRTLKEALRVRTAIPSLKISQTLSGSRKDKRNFMTAPVLKTDDENKQQEFNLVKKEETDLSLDEETISRASGFEPFAAGFDGIAEAEEKIDYAGRQNKMPVLNVLAWLKPTYILAGGEDGLYLIDQHAAHERILYEECLARKIENPVQCLLLPVTLELDYREMAILSERIIWFNEAGFLIEHFGGNTFLLRGVPPHFPEGQAREFLLDMLDYFRERGPGAARAEFFNHLASAIACRNAVKAGERLSQSSMEALLDRLAGTENPFTCPHGRPTMICLSFEDLEKRFKRS